MHVHHVVTNIPLSPWYWGFLQGTSVLHPKLTSRKLRAVNLDQLRTDVAALTTGDRSSNLDVGGLVRSYNYGLQHVLNQHAPLVTRCIRNRPSAPWLSSEVRDARRKRRRAERLWRRTKLSIHKEMYINMRNEVTKCITVAKRQYFTSKIDSVVFSIKQLFKVSNDLKKNKKKKNWYFSFTN